MNNHPETESLRELQLLVDRLLDEQLSSADCQRLEELICSNQACSDYYVQAMQLTAGLARGAMPPLRLGQVKAENTAELQAEVATLSAQVEALAEITLTQTPATTSETAAPQGRGKQSSGSPPVFPAVGDPTGDSAWIQFPKSFALFGLAMLVVGAFGGWLVTRSASPIDADRSIARNNNSSAAAPAIMPAAYVTMVNGCNWGGSTPEVWAVGRSVQLGDEITLHEGIAEFRLASGVSLSIEGPASLVLNSDSSMVLVYGKLTAHVPWTVTNFRATVGACQFTACDAELGLWQQGDKIDIHVFSGDVRASAPLMVYGRGEVDATQRGTIVTDDTGAFARGTITAGSALSLVSQGDVYKVAGMGDKADPEMFSTKLPMAGALPISASYVQSVLESKPLGYWRFESVESSRVVNEVGDGFDLKAVGDVRLVGRAGNHAAEFQPGTDAYLVSEELIDKLKADYTLEMWVKPSHLHHGGLLFLYHKDAPVHASGLELQGLLSDQTVSYRNAGTVRFVHHNRSLTGTPSGTSCFSENRYRNRRWYHVTAIKQGSEMRLFLDGKLSAMSRDSTPLAARLQLVIGLTLIPQSNRRFVGQLDEVAIYDRALSEQEVVGHFRLASQAAEEPKSDGLPGV